MSKLRLSLVSLAFATLPLTLASVATAYEGTGFTRYQLQHAWPKAPPSSALSDLPKPDAATPRGTVQRVPVVLPDPRDPLSKPANKRLTLTESATGSLGGPDTKTLGGPDTKLRLRGYEKSHRLAR